MNGAENLTMTGSSNPRAENLNWLSEVASAVSKGALNRHNPSQSQNVKTSASATNVHNLGRNSSPMLIANSSNMFSPSTVLTRTSDANNVRMFATPFHVERTRQVQPISVPITGTSTTLYYSQATHTTPYSNFIQGTYSPLPFSTTASQTPVTNPPVCHPNSQRSYLQVDNYPSLVSVQTIGSAHGQLPNSHSYLQRSQLPSSPTNLTLSSSLNQGRFFQQGRSILISRSPEGVVVHSPLERDPAHIQIQLSPVLPSDDIVQRKSIASTDSMLGSSSCSPVTDNVMNSVQATDFSLLKDHLSNQPSTSPSHIGYKLPTGKEGSLKHRILRPPSINIVDPPQSLVADAPLSAPPIRTYREASPKQTRSIPSSGYRSFSSSASSLTETSNRAASSGVSPNNMFINHRSSLSSGSPSPAPPISPTSTALKYPQSFMKGAIIQLANNQLKTVENMTTEDFIECGILSPTLKIDSSTVVSIEKMPSSGSAKLGFQVGQDSIQITVEAPLEHPFFVYKRGWSSCSPERSAQRYGLSCHKLKIGDTCISLTDKSDFENCEQKNVNSCETNLNTLDKNQNKLEKPTEDLKIESENLPLITNSSLMEKKLKLIAEKTSFKADQSTISRKRKRRWSAPDNLSQNEEGSSS
ncbi:ataxin-1-like [Parasteatoda tepidariorum]|uniref:ataxin-1-like n=1 Tax=Parasteatoda tepidariorum TaxID=114398 RepID=UPI00077FA139|nr:ataxin-1-like [Parasteatoda tepidariorum]XP_015912055.1 ataxin-1-like [Parasteatoda tepidariorum]